MNQRIGRSVGAYTPGVVSLFNVGAPIEIDVGDAGRNVHNEQPNVYRASDSAGLWPSPISMAVRTAAAVGGGGVSRSDGDGGDEHGCDYGGGPNSRQTSGLTNGVPSRSERRRQQWR